MRRLLLVPALGALALPVGCGGSGGFVTDRDAVLRIEMTEYRFDPQDVKVREGVVKIVATNAGRLTHNVLVRSIKDTESDRPTEYGRTDTAQPGQVVRASVTLGPGRYQLVCSIGNHDDLGQYGELQVTREP